MKKHVTIRQDKQKETKNQIQQATDYAIHH